MSVVSPLQAFSRLHRTVSSVFKGDRFAIEAARRKIREEFDKNRNVTNADEIQDLVQVALDADATLKTVVQLRLDEERDVYRVRHHKDVPMEDATPYKPLPKDFKPGRRGRGCQEVEY